jgi:hypothetical protein
VAYYVRRGDANPELRYSLRSLSNLPHGRVLIVGHKPAWVTGVEHISGNRRHSIESNAVDNLRLACSGLDADRFVVMNDDFYIMSPLHAVPALHEGHLDERISRARGGYLLQLRAAREALVGHHAPLAWTLHIPLVVEREPLADVLATLDGRLPPEWRTMYGNLTGQRGEEATDVKVRRRSDPIPAGPFLSSSDGTFSVVAPLLRRAFPEPCEYET